MKRKIFPRIAFALAIVILASLVLPITATQAAEMTIEVLNPKATIEVPEMIPLAERNASDSAVGPLAGKRIAFTGYSKDNGRNYFSVHACIADLLHAKYGRLGPDNPDGVEIITTYQGSWGDVLGEKGVFNYEAFTRGGTNSDVATAGYLNPLGVDVIIGSLAN